MATSLFDRVASIAREIGVEKQAAAKSAGSKGMGQTTHPSEKDDENVQDATEGAQSADNERMVRESVPENVVEKPDLTPASAPKATDVQLGQGVDAAKPTGEDPSTEDAYGSKPTGDKKDGDQGGTSHPAKGDYGEKYSSAIVANMSDVALFKAASELGNEIAADIATGMVNPKPAAKPAAKPQAQKTAADAGRKAAEAAAVAEDQLSEVASSIIAETVKSAYHQADLIAAHLANEMAILKRAAEEEEAAAAEAAAAEAGGGEAAPGGENGEAEALLAAMGGAGGEGGAMPPEAAGPMAGPEAGLGGEGGGAPPELGGMNDEQALQELAMALQEAGVDLNALAAIGGDGAKIAAAVQDFKMSGQFEFTEAKKGSAQRVVRDYMKGFVRELYSRSKTR